VRMAADGSAWLMASVVAEGGKNCTECQVDKGQCR